MPALAGPRGNAILRKGECGPSAPALYEHQEKGVVFSCVHLALGPGQRGPVGPDHDEEILGVESHALVLVDDLIMRSDSRA